VRYCSSLSAAIPRVDCPVDQINTGFGLASDVDALEIAMMSPSSRLALARLAHGLSRPTDGHTP
jgi:hypothetical protein